MIPFDLLFFDDMSQGYFYGLDDDRDEFPESLSNRSAQYRHGWLNGRDYGRKRRAMASKICTGCHGWPGCGTTLTDDERKYYGDSCEQCQIEWFNAIGAWLAGADDPEIEAMFEDKTPTIN